MIDWFDLPKLHEVSIGESSFYETIDLSLKSMLIADWLIGSSYPQFSLHRRSFLFVNNKFELGE